MERRRRREGPVLMSEQQPEASAVTGEARRADRDFGPDCRCWCHVRPVVCALDCCGCIVHDHREPAGEEKAPAVPSPPVAADLDRATIAADIPDAESPA